MFMLAEDLAVLVPRSFYIDADHGNKQEAFRHKVDESGVTRASVDSPSQLETLLYQALVELPRLARNISAGSAKGASTESIAAPVGGFSHSDRSHYESRVRERYRRLDLDALTPAERDDSVPVLLGQVFVPQLVRPGPPPLEVSKELWRKLIEAEELPEAERPDAVEIERWQRSYAELHDRTPRPVLEVLTAAESRLVVLLGDPGSGKSTLSRYLALTLAGNPDRPPAGTATEAVSAGEQHLAAFASWLPVVVELRAYADAQGRWDTFAGFLDCLCRTDEGPGLPEHTLDSYLRENGRAWVVFDGLDELFDLKARETVARQIAGFAARYPKIRVLITSRPIGYPRQILDAAGFVTYSLQDLEKKQIEAFLVQWYQVAYHHDSTQARRRRQRLLDSIDASPSIRELAGNPLLLTILAIIGKGRELPRDRQAVYAHAASVLTYHWDVNRHLSNEHIPADVLDVEDRKNLLRRIARLMQSTRSGLAGNHIDGETLKKEFDAYLINQYAYTPDRAHAIAAAMLRQLRERNFILSLFGADIYGFVHRAFLEYFCADDLRHRFEKTKELTFDQLSQEYFLTRWSDDAWREVLLLVADMVDPRFVINLLGNLLDAADPQRIFVDGYLPHNLTLVTRIIGEARQPAIFAEAAHRVTTQIQKLLHGATQRDDGFSRSAVLDYIAAQLLPTIAAAGTRWPSRTEYHNWFAGNATSLKPSVFSFSSRPSALTIAADLFGSMPAGLEQQDLRRRIQGLATVINDSNVRRAALQAIAAGWPTDADTLALLRDRATTDQHGAVRQAALQAIAAGWPTDADTLTLLRDRATTDPDEAVRQAALQAIAAGWPTDADTLTLLRDRATTDMAGETGTPYS
jgi:hypothetical protein